MMVLAIKPENNHQAGKKAKNHQNFATSAE
jgi:hypothetical protein